MISVVVPIYNEEELVFKFHEAVAGALNSTGEDYEVVYVNDGSKDSSLELLKELQTVDPTVVVVDLSRNFGHMGALSAGLCTARGEAVILMDGDFQDPPEVLPELIESWRKGAQVVTAVRRSREERRIILAKLFPLFYRVLGTLSDYPIPLNAGVFGLMDRQAVDSVNQLREGNRYLPGLRAWVGYKNDVVYYDRHDRAGGDGKLTFISRIKYAMDAITSFSYKPLRLCFALSCLSLLFVPILSILAAFVGGALAALGLGLAAGMLLIGSAVLFCLGILGEYLGRVYDEVRGRPLSIIRNVYYASEIVAENTEQAKIYRVA